MRHKSETLRLLRIFVSSPADVAEERGVLTEVVERVNETQGRANGVHLDLVRWERQVIPQIGPLPQDVIDAQIPSYDIYLGIMSSRFGTPTDTHGSGTEHEFRDAVERWGKLGRPWILFYFNDKPALSSKPVDVQQYLSVCTFREELTGIGIVSSYAGVRGSSAGFFEKVEQHLRLLVQNELPAADASEARPSLKKNPKTSPTQRSTVPQGYRDWLKAQCINIDLDLRRKEGHAVRLGNVYVPMTAQIGKIEVALRLDQARDDELRPQLLLDLLAKESLYVSGAPGAGKSTFCRWVAWLACEGDMPQQRVEAPVGYVESFPDALRNRLPVFVRLRDFWPHLPDMPSRREMSQRELVRAMREWVNATRPGGIAWPQINAHLDEGSAFMIIDGVDEVPLSRGDERHASSPREMLLSGLAAAAPDWIKRGNRLLITSRPYGLTEREADQLDMVDAPIADLDLHLQNLLVRRWFHILTDSALDAEATSGDMITHIRERSGLESLAANPLLLTAMCVIFSEGKRLPQDKYDLYVRIVDNVLYSRYPKDPAVIDLVRSRLNFIAYGMHTGTGLGEERVTPQPEATWAEIDRLMHTYREQNPWTEAGFKDAVETREQLLSRSGLLLPRGEKRAGFYHFSFQDFLAAQRLLDLEGDRLFDVFCARAAAPEWRSTLSFVFGALLATSASPERAIRLLGRLIDSPAIDSVGLQVTVSECLEILLGRHVRLQDEIEGRFRDVCLASISREVRPVSDRAILALQLGKLGDPRIVEDLRDSSGFVEVPAGTYVVGEDRRVFRLETPMLFGRYPVVNQQYALFMREGGYENPRWWSSEGLQWLNKNPREPVLWRNGKWNGPNQPIVGVSFWEAEAFAAWAGGRLPTEWEWEAAARGPKGLLYPWGDHWLDGICNTAEAGLQMTSPVGIFPSSRSEALGLEDMAGNVWEWCSDLSDPQERILRVVRGGAWHYVSTFARADHHVTSFPERRYDFVGFRVVVQR